MGLIVPHLIFSLPKVVREQCWLNEILLGAHWTPEGLKSEEEDVPADDTTATAEELQAVLSGARPPPSSIYKHT